MTIERKDKFIKTTDNFFPNYPNDMVEVSVALYYLGPETGRLCGYHSYVAVSGDDDFMMIIRGDKEDYERFLKLYNEMPEPVTKDWLWEYGLKQE